MWRAHRLHLLIKQVKILETEHLKFLLQCHWVLSNSFSVSTLRLIFKIFFPDFSHLVQLCPTAKWQCGQMLKQ